MHCTMLSLPDNRIGILFTNEYKDLLRQPGQNHQLVGFCLEVSSCIFRTHMYILWVPPCPTIGLELYAPALASAVLLTWLHRVIVPMP